MHRPVPAGAHDVCYALSVDPIILVQLHAESPFRMAGINANDIEGTTPKQLSRKQGGQPHGASP